MKAMIKEREEIADRTILVSFDLQGKSLEFKPGQFFFVELIDPPYKDDKGARRHFSFVNSPHEKGVAVMATRSRDSAFKRSLAEMSLGSNVEIGDIGGDDFVLPDNPGRALVFVAGGIGITPFISMIRYVEEEALDHRITLIYSNRDMRSTAFLDELRRHAGSGGIELILTMTQDPSWKGETRKVEAAFISDYVEDAGSKDFYIAGPPGMNKELATELLDLGLDKKRIRVSDFTGY